MFGCVIREVCQSNGLKTKSNNVRGIFNISILNRPSQVSGT